MKIKEIFKSKIFQGDLIFVLLFAVFASIYYDSVLNKGPLNLHIWRQTDCLSMTRNYAEGAPFFETEMHLQLADDYTSGKTAGEFPILYYTMGKIWQICGESYSSYRIFYLIILFFGLFAFFKSLKIILANQFWALTISFLLFTSPVYAFYGISFLTDAPAFSFVLIGLYFTLQYHRKNALKFIYLALLFFALAGLIKVSSLIAFIFLFGILILESFGIKTLSGKKLYHGYKHEWFGFISVFLIIFSWYYYAYYFNEIHQFKYTWNHPYPFWNLEASETRELISGLKDRTSIIFFSRPILYLMLFIGTINLFLYKKIPLFAYLSNLGIILGCLAYFLLWTPLLGKHDYYFIALLILFVGIFIPFIYFIMWHHERVFKGSLIKLFLGTFLLFNFAYCLSVVQLKTLSEEGNHIMVGNNKFVEEMHWVNMIDHKKYVRFEWMKEYVLDLGIKKTDKIVSIPDFTLNATLFFVDRKGWTGYANNFSTEDMERYIEKGAKYLFVSEAELLNDDYLAPYLENQVGSFEGVKIFKLTK